MTSNYQVFEPPDGHSSFSCYHLLELPLWTMSPTWAFAITVLGTDALAIWSGAGLCEGTLRQGSSCLSEGVSPHCALSFLMFTCIHLFLWCCRSEDLEYIYNQLRTIKVRGMVGLLDKLQSSYFPAFQAMFRDVAAGEEQQEQAAILCSLCISTALWPRESHLTSLSFSVYYGYSTCTP